jgi:hypothetical protein
MYVMQEMGEGIDENRLVDQVKARVDMDDENEEEVVHG